ncbi:hypothetical protein PLESTB_001421400 [Pleodorina starrii]|uniref:Uncharacterized protein n=1 Tax=Pleodorina starrii TaxID=330485 RepID=A0A9W6BW66_9CHLO|nr:hypothetical protein PLESTB_001421400 [Pleodorina starrii]
MARLTEVQASLLHKLLSLGIVQLGILLDALFSPRNRSLLPERYQTVVLDRAIGDSLQETVKATKKSGGQDAKRKEAWTTLATAVAGAAVSAVHGLKAAVCSRLGFKPWQIKEGAKRHEALVNGATTQAHQPYREAKRKDAVDQETVRAVHDFWLGNSTCSPYARDVVRVRLPPAGSQRLFTYIQRRHVQASYRELHYKYNKDQPTHQYVSYGIFVRLKPSWITPQQGMNRSVCVCTKCTNIRNLVAAIGNHADILAPKRRRLHGAPRIPDPFNADSLVEAAFCPYPYDEIIPSRSCLRGDCDNCGIDKLGIRHIPQDHPEGIDDNIGSGGSTEDHDGNSSSGINSSSSDGGNSTDGGDDGMAPAFERAPEFTEAADSSGVSSDDASEPEGMMAVPAAVADANRHEPDDDDTPLRFPRTAKAANNEQEMAGPFEPAVPDPIISYDRLDKMISGHLEPVRVREPLSQGVKRMVSLFRALRSGPSTCSTSTVTTSTPRFRRSTTSWRHFMRTLPP